MSYLKIISVNSGSSSIKFSVFDFYGDSSVNVNGGNPLSSLLDIDRILSCRIEEIGTEYGSFYLKDKYQTETKTQNFADHETALRYIFKKTRIGDSPLDSAADTSASAVESENRTGSAGGSPPDAVVHRYVHGGRYYIKPLIVGGGDIKKLSELNELAPLHNPSNLKGLEVTASILPSAKQICVFDTAFHGTIPLYAGLYPVPVECYEKFNIKKYGFHGISYSFIVNLLKLYKNDSNDKGIEKLIICHLGNGASVCAVKDGKSIDTSMGYTPLEGLMMGTRSGSIDPEIPFIIKKKLNLTDDAVVEILNKKSGLLGISKKTYDFKELMKQNDEYAKLALKMYVYRIVKFIGQYAAVLDGVNALVFTGGIGENSDWLRKEVCGNLTYLGINIDDEKNAGAAEYFRARDPFGRLKVKNSAINIESKDSAAFVFVVRTDEELQMAFESLTLLDNLNKK